jgi:hypothetical protein
MNGHDAFGDVETEPNISRLGLAAASMKWFKERGKSARVDAALVVHFKSHVFVIALARDLNRGARWTVL